MVDSFSLTFKWIVPRTSVVMSDRLFPHVGKKPISYMGKDGRNGVSFLVSFSFFEN